MLRGINRQDIFEEAEDYWTFIKILSTVQERLEDDLVTRTLIAIRKTTGKVVANRTKNGSAQFIPLTVLLSVHYHNNRFVNYFL